MYKRISRVTGIGTANRETEPDLEPALTVRFGFDSTVLGNPNDSIIGIGIGIRIAVAQA